MATVHNGKNPAGSTRRAISRYFRDLKDVRPKLRGRDLKDMGITPGPVYRRILDQLLAGRLNGELSSREEEMRNLFGSTFRGSEDVR